MAYCECGCGREVGLSKQRPRKQLRFVHGHNGRSVDPNATEKACSKCGEVKPLDEFHNWASTPDGKHPQCKPCLLAGQKAGRDPEKMRAWQKANREKVREYARESYARHREKRIASVTAWRKANPERVREITREAQRRREMRKLENFVEDVDALVVLEMDDGACGICGEDVDPMNFHLDHIVPISRGGVHALYNVRPAHPVCNQRKHAKLDHEMEAA